jgi:hypothetical protein
MKGGKRRREQTGIHYVVTPTAMASGTFKLHPGRACEVSIKRVSLFTLLIA